MQTEVRAIYNENGTLLHFTTDILSGEDGQAWFKVEEESDDFYTALLNTVNNIIVKSGMATSIKVFRIEHETCSISVAFDPITMPNLDVMKSQVKVISRPSVSFYYDKNSGVSWHPDITLARRETIIAAANIYSFLLNDNGEDTKPAVFAKRIREFAKRTSPNSQFIHAQVCADLIDGLTAPLLYLNN
jgi:hypothetical protein